jgi:Dehydrogenases with different specificities (related to short-chain alcohol dehydrogenases)
MISFQASDHILVTGASSGIGRAIALKLNALGASVLASGRDAARLSAVREQAACPERLHIEVCDLTREMESLPAWVAALRGRYGKLRGFVHCAGVTLTSPLREYDLAVARNIFDINFHGAMLLAKGFADRRNNVGHGASLLIIAAASAVTATPSLLIYSASKSALIAAMRGMSKELAPMGIRANAISPGLVKTPMGEEYLELLGEDGAQAMSLSYPLGLGEPQDVAAAAAFLLSSDARWITGQNILMTGGRD